MKSSISTFTVLFVDKHNWVRVQLPFLFCKIISFFNKRSRVLHLFDKRNRVRVHFLLLFDSCPPLTCLPPLTYNSCCCSTAAHHWPSPTTDLHFPLLFDSCPPLTCLPPLTYTSRSCLTAAHHWPVSHHWPTIPVAVRQLPATDLSHWPVSLNQWKRPRLQCAIARRHSAVFVMLA